MKTAFGSQVKMITALMLGKTIIASQKATIGINFNNKSKEVFIANNNNKFACWLSQPNGWLCVYFTICLAIRAPEQL